MANGGGSGGFILTPHKVSMCILLQAYWNPVSSTPPFSHLRTSDRHQLALFILHLSKASDNFLEPSLEQLGVQLKGEFREIGDILFDQLASHLLAFSAPDDLFTFFHNLRELLVVPNVLNDTPENGGGEEEHLPIEHNSSLGQFLRRCILAFNLLSFEGSCRLLTDLDAYRQTANSEVGEPLIDNMLSKKMEESNDEEEDERYEDDEYLDGENLEEAGGNLFSREQDGLPTIRGSSESQRYEHAFRILTSPSSEGGVPSRAGGLQEGLQDGGFSYAFGDVTNTVESSNDGMFLRPYAQIEAYMKEQADFIERRVGSASNEDLDEKLNMLEKLAPELHKVHYLRYLHCLSNDDYPAAMDNLHRYFDYSAGKGAVNINGTTSDANVGRFQAGLLTLGSMHACLGHVTQALQALNEAVRIAQQNNDDTCLAHALAALCHLLSEVGTSSNNTTIGATVPTDSDIGHGPSSGVQQQLLLLLKRCLRRALELRMPHLIAFSRLALVKFELKMNGSLLQHTRKVPILGVLRKPGQLATSPLEVYKTLKLSPYLLSDSIISSIAGSGAALSGGIQRPGGTISSAVNNLGVAGGIVNTGGWSVLSGRLGPTPRSLLQMAGLSHLLRTTSWELYGSAPMARFSTLISASCYEDVASADDLSLAYIKHAQYLATHKGYTEAFSALDLATKKLPVNAMSRVRAVRLQLIHERALHHGEIQLAQAACNELGALASPVHGVDMDLKIDTGLRHARTLLSAGQFDKAATVAHSLFCLCYKSNLQLDCILILLLLADIHKKAGSVVSGLPYALASLIQTQTLNLDLLHATSMVTLAELWLGLGASHGKRALTLLYQCMPMVLGHGGLELRARTHLAVARCHLHISSSVADLSQSNLKAVLEALQLAIQDFQILEDYEQLTEAFYLEAIIFHTLGKVGERNRASDSFKKFTIALEKAQCSGSAILV